METSKKANFFFGLLSCGQLVGIFTGFLFMIFMLETIGWFFDGIEVLFYNLIFVYDTLYTGLGVLFCVLMIGSIIFQLVSLKKMALDKNQIRRFSSLASLAVAIPMMMTAFMIIFNMLNSIGSGDVMNMIISYAIGFPGFILATLLMAMLTDKKGKSTPKKLKIKTIVCLIISFIYMGAVVAVGKLGIISTDILLILAHEKQLIVIFIGAFIPTLIIILSLFIFPKDEEFAIAGEEAEAYALEHPSKRKVKSQSILNKKDEDTSVIPEMSSNPIPAQFEAKTDPLQPVNEPHLDSDEEIIEDVNQGLTEVIVPSNVAIIQAHQYESETHLNLVKIPTSVIEIQQSAFANTPALSQITYLGTKEQFKAIKRGKGWIDKTTTINCLDGTLKINIKQTQGGDK